MSTFQSLFKLSLLSWVFIGFMGSAAAEPNEYSKLQSTRPQFVVKRLIEAMENNNADVIRSVFSKSANQRYGAGSPKSGEQFRKWLETDIIRVKGRVIEPTFSSEKNRVIVKGMYKNNNGYSSPADFLFTVQNGKITAWVMRY